MSPEVAVSYGTNEPASRTPVSSFFPLPLDVAPLGPDATMSLLVNAERWHAATLGAGTRLLMFVHLRDRFGNACSWAYEDADEPAPSSPGGGVAVSPGGTAHAAMPVSTATGRTAQIVGMAI